MQWRIFIRHKSCRVRGCPGRGTETFVTQWKWTNHFNLTVKAVYVCFSGDKSALVFQCHSLWFIRMSTTWARHQIRKKKMTQPFKDLKQSSKSLSINSIISCMQRDWKNPSDSRKWYTACGCYQSAGSKMTPLPLLLLFLHNKSNYKLNLQGLP